ncbi:MAG: AAA family ATPase, partial [Defluviitaleaceae bacterium]|nr:AAA family ATPase [Defluviitaleaceae bacterium]
MKRQITTSIITPNETTEDLTLNLETQLRPTGFAAYTGQERVKEKLQIYIQAAKERNEPLDHVLLYGPPGLGKTTLSNIIASEMNANIKTTSGPAIERAGDMVAMLYDLSEGDILFVDEIHR